MRWRAAEEEGQGRLIGWLGMSRTWPSWWLSSGRSCGAGKCLCFVVSLGSESVGALCGIEKEEKRVLMEDTPPLGSLHPSRGALH